MQVSGAMRGTSATAAGTRPTPSPLDHPRTEVATGVALVLACTATVAIAFVLARLASGDLGLVERALVYALLGAGLLAWFAARHHAAPTFGAANAVTLARGVLALDLLAVLGSVPNVTLAWVCVALALLALALDGVDGKVARSRGEVSAFGARFDMETDAALILVLCALAWQQGKVGPWILLAGALRYLFVAAGFALPWLARALPPSRRRQAACVVQVASLIVCLLPVVAPPVSGAVALIGLVALVGSFAADVGWLARARA
ncbi:MAG TPA: CDP-alcohol phosphatidyltransferase family protein [Gammaproteobacteria bacterium]|nr:CDP-alcohol phosphatidyltransferase family protein [Gammaproteobacteria bacterium]